MQYVAEKEDQFRAAMVRIGQRIVSVGGDVQSALRAAGTRAGGTAQRRLEAAALWLENAPDSAGLKQDVAIAVTALGSAYDARVRAQVLRQIPSMEMGVMLYGALVEQRKPIALLWTDDGEVNERVLKDVVEAVGKVMLRWEKRLDAEAAEEREQRELVERFKAGEIDFDKPIEEMTDPEEIRAELHRQARERSRAARRGRRLMARTQG